MKVHRDAVKLYYSFIILSIYLCLVSLVYKGLGCWTDKIPRAMTDLEGSSDALKVHYKRRENPIEKCYTAAIEHKMPIFGIQDGGQCFGSDSKQAAKQYGASSACSSEKGGPMANNVYELSK